MKAFLPLVLLAALACRNDEIEVRRVPREAAPAAPAEESPGRGLRWTVPRGWKELAGDGMRRATFTPPEAAGKAEVTVVALPGDAGGELANVNRWRGQLALAPMNEAQLALSRASVRSPAGTVTVYDFNGGGQGGGTPTLAKTRLIAGIVKVGRVLWFFKLMGEEEAVSAAAPRFLKLLETLRSDDS